MDQATELLNTLADGSTNEVVAEEPKVVINDDRFIVVPNSLKRLAVQNDHNVNTIPFYCPRSWNGIDMSTSDFKTYINYVLPDGTIRSYDVGTVTVDDKDDTLMRFNWVITKDMTENGGKITCLVCIRKTLEDGTEENHWNSELNYDFYISDGLGCVEPILEMYPDFLTTVLLTVNQNNYEYFEERIAALEDNADVQELKNRIPPIEADAANLNERLLSIENGEVLATKKDLANEIATAKTDIAADIDSAKRTLQQEIAAAKSQTDDAIIAGDEVLQGQIDEMESRVNELEVSAGVSTIHNYAGTFDNDPSGGSSYSRYIHATAIKNANGTFRFFGSICFTDSSSSSDTWVINRDEIARWGLDGLIGSSVYGKWWGQAKATDSTLTSDGAVAYWTTKPEGLRFGRYTGSEIEGAWFHSTLNSSFVNSTIYFDVVGTYN